MNFLSTFTGVGGFDRGFENAGMTCIGMCELDPHAMTVLNHHWKDVPKHDDITTAISSGWADQFIGRTDVLIGGAPCQDLSKAGKRQGFQGERSVLFFDMVELASYVGANYIVYENVPGILTSTEGRDFGAVIHALAEAGFSHIEWRTLDSQQFGVPQRRKRVFLVAATPATSRYEIFPFGEERIGDLTSINPQWQNTPGTITDSVDTPSATYWDGGQTSDCLDVSMLVKGQMLPEKRRMPVVLVPTTFVKGRRAQTNTDHETWDESGTHPTLNCFDNGDVRTVALAVTDYDVRRLTPMECERLQGFPDNWTLVEYKGKPMSDSQRYKQMGNAVTVTVAEHVARHIIGHSEAGNE
jgi:DNA (cytosine-5)-methyltransferase 1